MTATDADTNTTRDIRKDYFTTAGIPTVSVATGRLDPERGSLDRSRTKICDQLVY